MGPMQSQCSLEEVHRREKAEEVETEVMHFEEKAATGIC